VLPGKYIDMENGEDSTTLAVVDKDTNMNVFRAEAAAESCTALPRSRKASLEQRRSPPPYEQNLRKII
jgi:hypothetical protein